MVKGEQQTVSEHFKGKWEDWIRGKWRVLLRDLGSVSDTPPTHAEAIAFGKGVTGFNSGLTPLQFANTLALRGIVARPTIESLADWVVNNDGLGCFHGLTSLGFRLPVAADFKDSEHRKIWVQGALQLVYNYLDTVLTDDEKEQCDFGVIFLEHLLCKVSRWRSMFAKYSQSFADIARKAVERYNIEATSIELEDVEEVLQQLPKPSQLAEKVWSITCTHSLELNL
ncbi:hypothetical protein PENSPDRAFT_595826 [Peniophora sp. CONT]|nr:hypothetical protein PENSPDRAFT_595826 [Peniophora sp. CONT]